MNKSNVHSNRFFMSKYGRLYALFTLACWAWAVPSSAQLPSLPDSLQRMTPQDLTELVLAQHPIAKQADLQNDKARQELRMARGYFDPKLESKQDAKEFKGKDYYTLWNSYLKVPTWWGAEFKVGYEQNTGINLNPESDTDSENGLGYIGVSLPLGPLSRNFLMDKRRETLRKAEIYQDIAGAERQKMLNKLVYSAMKDYWEWYFAYHQVRLFEYGYNLAELRYQAVINEIEQGFRAPIDSTETKITLQQRMIDLRNARVAAKNARLMLSNHLWTESGEPAELAPDVAPVDLPQQDETIRTLAELRDFAVQNHPELLKLRYKLGQLEVSKKLAVETLKPEINLKYNWLVLRPIAEENLNTALLSENYKWGFSFSMPLLLRKERGKLGLTKVKIEENLLDTRFTQLTIVNSIEAAYNDLVNLSDLLGLQEDMVKNYRRMLSGERQKFDNGLSSVFYMNVREGKLIESLVKLYKMRSAFAKSKAGLLWQAGVLVP